MNPFTVLGLPEKAALVPDEIKERFQELSRAHHPDRAPGTESENQFAAINQAYQQLQSPGSRLKSLLELRFAETFQLKGSLPDAFLDLFSQISTILQSADTFLAKKAKATTTLAEALLAPELLQTQKQLGEAGNQVNDRLAQAEAHLAAIDRLINQEAPEALATASALCREFLYLEKWQGQIQSRFHQLF